MKVKHLKIEFEKPVGQGYTSLKLQSACRTPYPIHKMEFAKKLEDVTCKACIMTLLRSFSIDRID